MKTQQDIETINYEQAFHFLTYTIAESYDGFVPVGNLEYAFDEKIEKLLEFASLGSEIMYQRDFIFKDGVMLITTSGAAKIVMECIYCYQLKTKE